MIPETDPTGNLNPGRGRWALALSGLALAVFGVVALTGRAGSTSRTGRRDSNRAAA